MKRQTEPENEKKQQKKKRRKKKSLLEDEVENGINEWCEIACRVKYNVNCCNGILFCLDFNERGL